MSLPMAIPAPSTGVRVVFVGLQLRCRQLATQHGLAGDSSSDAGERMAHRTAVMFIALAPAVVRVWPDRA
jgi:hypothetical protein